MKYLLTTIFLLLTSLAAFPIEPYSEELLQKAQGDNPQAQYHLGIAYYAGKNVTKSYTEAIKWWQKAAANGVADAMYNLGICYDYGRGVAQDFTQAVKWYQKAAELGIDDAMYNLGYCYYEP